MNLARLIRLTMPAGLLFLVLLRLLTRAYAADVGFQSVSRPSCQVVLTSVRMEVAPLLLYAICSDNSSTALRLTSGQDIWYERVTGFCNSFDLNIGRVSSNHALTYSRTFLDLVKSGQVLDNARVVILSSDHLNLYRISVWGQRNTRFVLSIVRKCTGVAWRNGLASTTLSPSLPADNVFGSGRTFQTGERRPAYEKQSSQAKNTNLLLSHGPDHFSQTSSTLRPVSIVSNTHRAKAYRIRPHLGPPREKPLRSTNAMKRMFQTDVNFSIANGIRDESESRSVDLTVRRLRERENRGINELIGQSNLFKRSRLNVTTYFPSIKDKWNFFSNRSLQNASPTFIQIVPKKKLFRPKATGKVEREIFTSPIHTNLESIANYMKRTKNPNQLLPSLVTPDPVVNAQSNTSGHNKFFENQKIIDDYGRPYLMNNKSVTKNNRNKFYGSVKNNINIIDFIFPHKSVTASSESPSSKFDTLKNQVSALSFTTLKTEESSFGFSKTTSLHSLTQMISFQSNPHYSELQTSFTTSISPWISGKPSHYKHLTQFYFTNIQALDSSIKWYLTESSVLKIRQQKNHKTYANIASFSEAETITDTYKTKQEIISVNQYDSSRTERTTENLKTAKVYPSAALTHGHHSEQIQPSESYNGYLVASLTTDVSSKNLYRQQSNVVLQSSMTATSPNSEKTKPSSQGFPLFENFYSTHKNHVNSVLILWPREPQELLPKDFSVPDKTGLSLHDSESYRATWSPSSLLQRGSSQLQDRQRTLAAGISPSKSKLDLPDGFLMSEPFYFTHDDLPTRDSLQAPRRPEESLPRGFLQSESFYYITDNTFSHVTRTSTQPTLGNQKGGVLVSETFHFTDGRQRTYVLQPTTVSPAIVSSLKSVSDLPNSSFRSEPFHVVLSKTTPQPDQYAPSTLDSSKQATPPLPATFLSTEPLTFTSDFKTGHSHLIHTKTIMHALNDTKIPHTLASLENYVIQSSSTEQTLLTPTATWKFGPPSMTSGTNVSQGEGYTENQDQAVAESDTFWPVVAALVVGIPSVIVFGIAITVFHRRRTPDPQKLFNMQTLRSAHIDTSDSDVTNNTENPVRSARS